jgi:protein-L-isoaspartate(D-aspartate) O-methyltransferase
MQTTLVEDGAMQPLPSTGVWIVALLSGLGCMEEPAPAVEDFGPARARMVAEQLKARDIHDARVLNAMAKVPRHEFVLPNWRDRAYDDSALPIRAGQTISQPYVVAYMTQAVEPKPKQRVLEIGTGSGYQAAVLAELVAEVYSIEIVPELADEAGARLKRLGYRHVQVRNGDGYKGWPEAAPFDAILVTCGADHVPQPLVDQLHPQGRMIMPVGPRDFQELQIITKDAGGKPRVQRTLPVRFVPLVREQKP